MAVCRVLSWVLFMLIGSGGDSGSGTTGMSIKISPANGIKVVEGARALLSVTLLCGRCENYVIDVTVSRSTSFSSFLRLHVNCIKLWCSIEKTSSDISDISTKLTPLCSLSFMKSEKPNSTLLVKLTYFCMFSFFSQSVLPPGQLKIKINPQIT